MANFVIERLQAEGLRSRAEAEAWDAMCRLLTEHPALLEKLHAILLNPESNGVPDPARMAPARRPDLLNWQRISGFILSRGNEWRSFREIAEGTGISRTCVQWVLYTGEQSVFFEQKKASAHGRKKLWRVKPEYADDPTLQTPDAQELPQNTDTEETDEPSEDIVVRPRPKHPLETKVPEAPKPKKPIPPRAKWGRSEESEP